MTGADYYLFCVVFSTNAVCVKTQQKHGSMKHHDKTKLKYNQLKKYDTVTNGKVLNEILHLDCFALSLGPYS